MKTQLSHRQSLVSKLVDLVIKKDYQERMNIEADKDKKSEHLKGWREVDLWLLDKQIELVEKALENNELDNF